MDANRLLLHGDEHAHPGGAHHHGEVVNYDLIKEQIKLAAGENISGKNYYPQMVAIRAASTQTSMHLQKAQDASRSTAPGRVRLDTHVYSGYDPAVLRLDDFKPIVVAQTGRPF